MIKYLILLETPNMMSINVELFQWFINFFDKITSHSGIKNENIPNKKLPEELHKPFIRKFNNIKVHSPFIDNIWGADFTDVQLISRFNIGVRCSLCVIDIYSKYAWVIPLKDEKGVSITNAFRKTLKESNRKPIKNMGW